MEDVLQQGTRRRLYETVREHPGLSARELQRRLHLGWGETAYHLDQLTTAGAVRRERGGHQDYYFSPELTLEDRRILLTLRSPTERKLLLQIATEPGLTFPELGVRAGLSKSTVSFHLRRLLDLGLIEGHAGETGRRYQVPNGERVVHLVRLYQESFRDRLVDHFVDTFAALFRE